MCFDIGTYYPWLHVYMVSSVKIREKLDECIKTCELVKLTIINQLLIFFVDSHSFCSSGFCLLATEASLFVKNLSNVYDDNELKVCLLRV